MGKRFKLGETEKAAGTLDGMNGAENTFEQLRIFRLVSRASRSPDPGGPGFRCFPAESCGILWSKSSTWIHINAKRKLLSRELKKSGQYQDFR